MSRNDKLPVNTLFDPTKIQMESRVQSVYALVSRVEHGEISTPTYQRGSVWTNETKSRLIESLIVKIPIPIFYLDATVEDDWKIVDGLQRITTLKEFIIDKTLTLTGLEYIDELEGCNFDELPRAFQRRILETDVTVLFINPGTPENVKYNIFKRINTGGMPLSDQEIRHALNNGEDGKATDCLQNIVSDLEFKKTWGGKNANDRMELNELVLRAFGSWFVDENFIYNVDINTYLVESMNSINNTDDSLLEVKVKDFHDAYEIILDIFDSFAFRKIKMTLSGHYSKPRVNKNIYEAWMFCLRHLSKNQRKILVKKKELVVDSFAMLLTNKQFGWAVNSRKQDTMLYRNRELMGMITRVVKND
ncbi:DUF262 domain-containing protein [Vibrio scophthalmi]|uniref:DUF262 domain-containing protein n=1 Tax=Vibrio scophthalmi TaxID=45658 RepID=UPI002284B372|nr:DUF262 domain-containing protein [Vibrio scophthalmi]MCY9805356.1 DUF262 domain-containing protein [Vibrio scophthalmi]